MTVSASIRTSDRRSRTPRFGLGGTVGVVTEGRLATSIRLPAARAACAQRSCAG